MLVRIVSTVMHDGETYNQGEEVDFTDQHANTLIEAGAAQAVEAKVEEVKKAPRSAKPAKQVKAKVSKDDEVKTPDADGSDDAVLPDEETINGMNRGDLEKLAAQVGIDNPGNVDTEAKGDYPNKKALRDAILAKVNAK